MYENKRVCNLPINRQQSADQAAGNRLALETGELFSFRWGPRQGLDQCHGLGMSRAVRGGARITFGCPKGGRLDLAAAHAGKADHGTIEGVIHGQLHVGRDGAAADEIVDGVAQ